MARKEGRTTIGLIVGNRSFFPDHLCKEGREVILRVLAEEGFDVVTLAPSETKLGTVESYEDAKKCAALFQKNAERIDGVLVTLPNFGDERGIADTLRMADLDVPVLIHAFPDDPEKMAIQHRRDSFCGKMSVCNNLTQYGIPFSLTELHTVDPESESFRADLQQFGACCRVVRGLRGARLGAVGARPAAFKTVRFSEKLLELSGISVETIDLYDLFGRIERISDDDPMVREKLDAIRRYADGAPGEALLRMAKFGAVLDQWVREEELDAIALQCWTAIEENFGIVPCTVMSMLSDALLPSACEVDVTGALGMLALRLASNQPSALLDWNNNYGNDPDMCVLFHCSNLPKSIFKEVKMSYHEIIMDTVGKENAWGVCVGPIRPGPFTFLRLSTDETVGVIRGYTGEGEVIDEQLTTFGGYGVAHIPDLQDLLNYICANGFEHHVAFNPSEVSLAVYDALANYLGWDIYYHE